MAAPLAYAASANVWLGGTRAKGEVFVNRLLKLRDYFRSRYSNQRKCASSATIAFVCVLVVMVIFSVAVYVKNNDLTPTENLWSAGETGGAYAPGAGTSGSDSADGEALTFFTGDSYIDGYQNGCFLYRPIRTFAVNETARITNIGDPVINAENTSDTSLYYDIDLRVNSFFVSKERSIPAKYYHGISFLSLDENLNMTGDRYYFTVNITVTNNMAATSDFHVGGYRLFCLLDAPYDDSAEESAFSDNELFEHDGWDISGKDSFMGQLAPHESKTMNIVFYPTDLCVNNSVLTTLVVSPYGYPYYENAVAYIDLARKYPGQYTSSAWSLGGAL